MGQDAEAGGGLVMTSPWLIQTGIWSGMRPKIDRLSSTTTDAAPYSRLLEGSTTPPSASAISCMP